MKVVQSVHSLDIFESRVNKIRRYIRCGMGKKKYKVFGKDSFSVKGIPGRSRSGEERGLRSLVLNTQAPAFRLRC